MKKDAKRFLKPFLKIGVIFCLIPLLLGGCSVFNPYDEHPLAFTNTFTGVPETPKEAYFDSKHGINPARFDPEWLKQRIKDEKKYCRLIEARAKAVGLLPSNVDVCASFKIPAECYTLNGGRRHWDRIKWHRCVELEKQREKKIAELDKKIREFIARKSAAGEKGNYSYRALLFNRLKSLLESPETPMIVPPEVVRVLILPAVLKEKDGRSIYVTSYYVYFLLDHAHWTLYQGYSGARSNRAVLPGRYLILKPFVKTSKNGR